VTDTNDDVDIETGLNLTTVDFDPFAEGEIQLTVPSTESQREIWLAVMMGPEANCAYNQSISLQLSGALDVIAMKHAFRALLDRHDALRATFSADGMTLCITEAIEIDVPFIDLSDHAQDARESELQNLIDSEVEVPFNLETGPLVRAKIVKLEHESNRILFTAHHIICDGWSMSCLVRDLGRLYTAIKNNSTPDLSEPYKFSDYALHEEEQRNNSNEQAEAYWLDLYSDDIPITDLPTDRLRLIRTYNGAREDLKLDHGLVKGLQQVGAEYGCTLFTVLLAGFEVLLCRVTGQNDIVIGIPTAGQLASGMTTLVGHCVNFLPIRARVETQSKFSDLLCSVRTAMLDAYDNQLSTFGSIIKKLPQITRDPSRIPFTPIMFNVDQALDEYGFHADDVTAEFFSNPRHFENFELSLNVFLSADSLVFECAYNTDLFDKETILARLQEYENILRSVLLNATQHVNELPLLTNDEQQKLLSEWNSTDEPYPVTRCLHQLIEGQVDRTPDAIAVCFEGHELSYRMLDEKANQLAHHLRSFGVGPDVMVGVSLERSEQMLIAVLGVLKAGGAYVPMDPEYPQERLIYMLEHARMPVLLTESALLERLPEHRVKVVCLDRDWDSISQCSADRAETNVQPEHLAYVIYTSGSTGMPKGVQVPHGAVVNFLSSMAHKPGLSAEDNLLAVTTLSFDIAVLELYLPLMVGGRVAIVDRETSSDGDRLLNAIQRNNISVMQATPATWRLLLSAGWEGGAGFKVLVGGEALPRDLANELIERVGGVWNMYGPTETTVWSTCEYVSDKEGPTLIGRPIGNTQLYVLDERQQPVPIGVPGELYIGGAGVVRGYLNAAKLTEEKFIPNPFSEEPQSRLYRTGDQVKYHRDGRLEYLARLDNQVKIRGFRIELGEIETCLLTHPAVKQSVVTVREDRPGDVRLVAYVVAESGEDVTVTEVRKHLRSSLPEYMIPQHVVELDALPMTPNGKIDRKALPAPFGGIDLVEETYVAPRTEMEQALAAIWQEVLNVERVGIHDNFFDLGGHSLLSMQVIALTRDRLDKKLTPRAMLMNNLEQLAQQCGDTISDGAQKDLAGNEKDSVAVKLLDKIKTKIGM